MSGVTQVRLHGIRSCDACRRARRWLDSEGIDYDYVDIRDDGLDERRLRRWESAAGWEDLINRRSITWRNIPDVDRTGLGADRAIELILAYPTVMKRPVLEIGRDVVLGFDEERYRQHFGSR